MALSLVIIVSFHKFYFPVLLKRKFLAKPRYATFQKNVAQNCILLLPQNSYNYSAQNTFFLLISHIWEHGTPTFFSWSFFPRQKCLHTFPLRRKKSVATTKIPSVRHFQNLKSAFWEAYMGKSLRRRRIFFFFWGGFFFFPPTRKPDLWLVCIPPRPVVYKILAPNLVEAG